MAANRDYVRAHAFSGNHRPEIESSEVCGCFYCLSIFKPSEIEEWIDEPQGGQTAVCPKCGIDSVIGSRSGFQINRGFLERMCDYWFSATPSNDIENGT